MEDKRIALLFVLNDSFCPESQDSAYTVGATGFCVALVQELAATGIRPAFVLYQRDEHLSVPALANSTFLNCPAIRIRFHFAMDQGLLSQALGDCARRLPAALRETGQFCVVFYYQSSTFLPFTPPGYPFVVTHHGPFVHDVRSKCGDAFAIQAFGGGPDKVLHLHKYQKKGLDVLRHGPGAAIEMSSVQRRTLVERGVPVAKIFPALPPASLLCNNVQRDDPYRRASEDEPALHLFTAAARVDRFKNFGELILAANILVRSGVRVRLSMFVGGEGEDRARSDLKRTLIPELRCSAQIGPKLGHGALLRCMSENRKRGVFVCSSVYETLGITPLEAISSGMATVAPARRRTVGVTDYIGSSYQYYGGAAGLAAKLASLSSFEDLSEVGLQQRTRLRSLVRGQEFTGVLSRVLCLLTPTPANARHSELPEHVAV